MIKFFQKVQFHKIVTFFKDVTIKGALTLIGNITHTGNLDVTGSISASVDADITGEVRASTVVSSGNTQATEYIQRLHSEDLSNPPDGAELDTLFGTTPNASLQNQIIRLVHDTANDIQYLVSSNGVEWQAVALTAITRA